MTFSKEAARHSRLQKRVHCWADTINRYLDQCYGSEWQMMMVTLTYRGVDDWRPGDIGKFTRQVRRWAGKGLLACAWTGELQKRGAVHYHVLLALKKGLWFPNPDQNGWWPHGMSRVERARTIWYICKYISKAGFQGEDGSWHDFPKGMRLFNVWINPEVFPAGTLARWMFRRSAWPMWLGEVLAEFVTSLPIPRRHQGGGWQVIQPDGEVMIYEAPWKLLSWR